MITRDFFQAIIHPDPNAAPVWSFRKTVRLLAWAIGFSFAGLAISFGISILFGIVAKVFDWPMGLITAYGTEINPSFDIIKAIVQDARSIWIEGGWVLVAFAVLIPLWEELAFRLPLVFSKKNLRISFVAFLLLITNFITAELLPNGTTIPIVIIEIGVTVLVAYMFFRKWDQKHENIRRWYGKCYPVLFWASPILFGIMHFTSIHSLAVWKHFWYMIPVITLPQIIAGFGLSYIRIRSGFWTAFAFHLFGNAIIVPVFYSILFGGVG